MNENKVDIVEKYIEDLKTRFESKPDEALMESNYLVKRIKKANAKELHKHILENLETKKEKNKIRIFLIALITIVGFSSNLLYFFGMAFFLAGYYVVTDIGAKYIGIVFLASHGLTGLAIMIYSFFLKIGNNIDYIALSSIFSDLNIVLQLIIIIASLLIITSTLMLICYNLIDKLKEQKYMKEIPMVLYLVALILISIFSHAI